MFERLSPLFPYLRRYWKSYALGGIAVIIYNVSKSFVPIVVGRAIDDMQHALNAAKIEKYSLLLLAIASVSGICLYLARQILIGASREIEYDIRNDLFAHLETQPASFFHRHRTGDIMARSTNDLNAVRQLLGPAIMYSANTIVFTAAALPFMIRMSPRLTLIAFLPLPIASIVVQYFGARIHTRFERIQAMFSDISAQAEENFSGARLIRAFAQEEAQIEAFEDSNREYIRRSLLLARLMAMLWPTLEFFLGLSLMLTLLVGGHQVLLHMRNPNIGLTVGQFSSYSIYMVQLTFPMIAIGYVVNLVQRGAASVVRIHELLQEKPTIADNPTNPSSSRDRTFNQTNRHPAEKSDEGPASSTTTNLSSRPERSAVERPASPQPTASSAAQNGYPEASASGLIAHPENGPLAPAVSSSSATIKGHITFNHLTFAYPTGPTVLHDITLDIPAGSSLAITGPTGSGKSTLVSLLPRLYDPRDEDANPNSILLDNRPLRDYPLAMLRRAIGFVPQETFLFSTTIADNIAFADAEPNQHTAAEIEAAARTAYIATEILDFPQGFATLVGERGMTLSGGQKQRTALARAILRDPRILILDDALASVDTYTEEQILNALRTAMQGRTTILIAHRVSTARNADRIAVLVEGRIAELGNHDELIALGGYYTDLVEKQSLEEELLTAQ
jgi:ATP-binding cassette subfamily B multidrug efflux pump